MGAKSGVTAFVDAYAVLGVDPGAGQDELKAAHRRLVRSHHPDLQPPDARVAATRQVQDINVAYGLVRDPAVRSRYDRLRQQARRREGDALDAAGSAAWDRLVTDAGRWAGRWWRRNRGAVRQTAHRAQRAGRDVVGRVRWLVSCVVWTLAGLLAGVIAQDAAAVDGAFTLLVGGLGGLAFGHRRGWHARLRTAGIRDRAPAPARSAALAVAALGALAAGVWLDGRL